MTSAIAEDEGMNAAIAKGIALLDAHGPEGWRQRLSLSVLDMRWVSRCVLGQAYGSYYSGREVLFRAAGLASHCTPESELTTLAVEHGFQLPYHGCPGSDDDLLRYGLLTATWRAALAAGS